MSKVSVGPGLGFWVIGWLQVLYLGFGQHIGSSLVFRFSVEFWVYCNILVFGFSWFRTIYQIGR